MQFTLEDFADQCVENMHKSHASFILFQAFKLLVGSSENEIVIRAINGEWNRKTRRVWGERAKECLYSGDQLTNFIPAEKRGYRDCARGILVVFCQIYS